MKPRTPRWVYVVVVLIGVAVALASAQQFAPAYALHSNLLWRVQVGAASAVLLWPVARALVLAWHGWTFFGPLPGARPGRSGRC